MFWAAWRLLLIAAIAAKYLSGSNFLLETFSISSCPAKDCAAVLNSCEPGLLFCSNVEELAFGSYPIFQGGLNMCAGVQWAGRGGCIIANMGYGSLMLRIV